MWVERFTLVVFLNFYDLGTSYTILHVSVSMLRDYRASRTQPLLTKVVFLMRRDTSKWYEREKARRETVNSNKDFYMCIFIMLDKNIHDWTR